ncbi:MAG: hypothetical protein MCSN_1710 [Candidatus Microsyncoccus archaeolyticus]|nr:MAG: hypothetical protein MCSN_1710 [Candidatus Parcubacteria bacterium]
MPSSIHTTKIKLPELNIENKRIGGNKVVQRAQKETIIDVDVYEYQPLCFLLKNKDGQEFYLKMPRSRVKITSGNILKAKTLSDIKLLDKDSVLLWEDHVFKNASKNPKEIIKSWENSFYFKQEGGDFLGLRKPQLGAIHAIASHWSVSSDCGTIVMPTGTGKTETMISTMIYNQCQKVLILVPSKALRKQTAEKFLSLGCLKEIGVISKELTNPRVAIINKGIKNLATLNDLLNNSNVMIATSSALNKFSVEIKEELARQCSNLFIDEAHHVPAKTWDNIKQLFVNKPILQFTATPFRTDGKRIEGKILYNYPLGMAQDDNYFKKINLVEIQEFDDNKNDERIAKSAIDVLKNDLSDDKYDHILMARCKDIKRAKEVVKIYEKIAPEYNPTSIYSDMPDKEYNEAIEKLNKREIRVIVCVDMLGEGFDLPNLKIAALHDIHKSLAVTLQFIGRFTRISKKVGDATAIINVSDPQVSKELEDLYAQGADWNKLLKQKSESTIQKEIDFHNFIDGFSGELPRHISLWNLRPAFSTLIYETKCKEWHPEKFIEVIPKRYEYLHAVNEKENILVVLISKDDEVNWGKYKDIKNHNFELCVAHWDKDINALFLQCSDYNAVSCIQLAKALCGDDVLVKNGQKVFNIFSGVERVLARNVGVSTVGKISYTMHFGSDITDGLSKVDKATGVLSNIFGWGFEKGERVAEGCSARKGKIWAMGGGSIILWKQWCHKMAIKVFDDKIEENKIIQDFLKPQILKERYRSVPLSIQWSENILKAEEDNIVILFGKEEHQILDVDLNIANYDESGPIFFEISSGEEKSKYKAEFAEGKCTYALVDGKEIKIKRGSGEPISLIDYVENDPINIIYADGTFSWNNFHVPTPPLSTFFDKENIKRLDWPGIDIRAESMGKECKEDSIQYRILKEIENDYDVIFNDDASGEAADIVAIRQESSDSFKLHLIHCKFSSSDKPGSRIDDFYALCGQAQKCIRWKHNGMEYLSNHIKKREESWKNEGKTRFLKGDMSDLNRLKKFSRHSTNFIFEVSIVQPGLLKDNVSDDIIQLLGSTEDYLMKTSGAKFNVYCS